MAQIHKMNVTQAMEAIWMISDGEDEGNHSYDPESIPTDEELDFENGIDPVQERSICKEEDHEQPCTSTPTAVPSTSDSPGRGRHRPALRSSPLKQKVTETWRCSQVGSSPGRARSRSPTARSICKEEDHEQSCTSTPTADQSSRQWQTENDPDIAPSKTWFTPRRTPGVQVDTKSIPSPLELFQLYFSPSTVQILCNNTNRQAARNVSMGKRYKWTDVSVPEFFKYIGLVVFIAMLPLSHVQDYWRRNNIFSVPFPATVMTRDRFRVLSWNIHISNPEEDVENDSKKGTPDHDCLFRTRHLLDDIRTACLSCYHPRINLAIDERMVATKARIGIKQYMKNKPTKWGFKLFVLADSSNGYTLDFTVYTGKTKAPSGNGLSYDSVMNLLKPSYLGTGYNIYVNNFYTSPKLFLDLAKMKFGACGTYRDNRKGFPSGRANALNSNSPRGSIRWIREDPLLFVKWMDTREVSLCSTIHPAFSSETVQRRVKGSDGHWTLKDIPCPTPVMAYNKHMGGVDLSDQLIQYYTTHRTSRWYQTLFYNFLDIATTNAYILHCEISEVKQAKPMTHKDFMEALIAGLCGTDRAGVSSSSRGSSHVPVAIALSTDPSKKATQGRRSCERCRTVHKKIQMTPWKCKACDVSLCLIVDRNCFEKWHSKTEKNT